MGAILRRVLLVSALCLALGACATVAGGPEFKPVPAGADKGVVYVYAPGHFSGYGESPVVAVDGKEVDKLNAKGYMAIPVSAGKHTITMHSVLVGVKLGGRDVPVSVASGGSAYVRIDRKFDSLAFTPTGPIPIYINVMTGVPNEIGQAEITKTRQSAGA
jgi:hypothetical protein